VRKEGRRERVNAALAGWRAAHGPCAVSARAVTLEDAVQQLGAVLGATPPPAQGPAPVPLAPGDLDTLRSFYQAALKELGAAGRPLPEALRATALRARAVLSREGQPPPGAPGGEVR